MWSKIVGSLYAEQKYNLDPSEFYPQEGDLPNISTISSEGEEEKKETKMKRSESSDWATLDGIKK